MRIVFFVERPTQFEVPFYRFAARDPDHHLRVVYTGGDPLVPAFDPELSRPIDWGFDLVGGYDWAVLPVRRRGRWLAAELTPGSYDLAIVNGYTQSAYLRAARRARRSRIPTALRLDSVADAGRDGARTMAKRALYRAVLPRLFDRFLGVGTGTLAFLAAHGIPEERRGLFPYAIDVEGFRERSRVPPEERAVRRAVWGAAIDARVVLSLAKFGPREAPWDLLRAFPRIAAADSAARLVLAGDGPERSALEAEARALGLSDRIFFPGYVPYPELPTLYGTADLFVHPAAEERWGVSVQEALACGLPVIASEQVGAGRDLILPGRNGFQYPAGNAEALAQAILAALALPRAGVETANREILARWDYAATWRHLLAAASA
ncbi:MAG TPA: glycosyltransferase [Thermoanaerobaculia bacterium]|nr:glycosyltransferase [Thermoanaerobaculia bacterium]